MDELKSQGNAAFSSGDHVLAIKKFSEALEIDTNNHVLYSNRSAAYSSSKDYAKALEDAEQAIACRPSWSKGYGRKGAALLGLGRYAESQKAYTDGLAYEPENAQLKKGLADAEAAAAAAASTSSRGSSQNPFSQFNPFASPDAFERISKDPTCQSFLAQPDFIQKLNHIKQDPSSMSQYMQDSRILQAMMVAMGINMKSGADETASSPSSDTPHPCGPEPHDHPHPHPHPHSSTATATATATSAPASAPTASTPSHASSSPSPSPSSPSINAARSASDAEKELGNKEYAKKNFESALAHYNNAWELDTTNISVLTNKAAVLFEQEQFDSCIALCEEAVEKGREVRADFKLIAKALGRIGSAYAKKGDTTNAIKYYNKSLTEHRTPDVLRKLRDLEKRLELEAKLSYHDPALSEQERNLGNELFKKGDFVAALKHYTEATKRDEKDPRNYSNRAACYTKLAAFPEAMKDCDTCIGLDPSFTKAYLRKAAIFMARKEYQKCIDSLTEARAHDRDGKNKAEIDAQLTKCYLESSKETSSLSQEETLKRAMQDPELSSIISDPIMQQILQQMQSNPSAIQEHMKNPMIATKIRKLMTAGIIRMA